MTGAAISSVLVIAKEPIPGRVKTRLTPPFTPRQAAELAAAALADTIRAASAVAATEHLLVLDGRPESVDAPGWRVVPQGPGGLDERLAGAFDAACGPAVLVGMDTPQLRPDHLRAFDFERYDCCLGPAADGGFWAIGFARPSDARRVIPGVPMSRADSGARQLERLVAAGLRVQILGELIDVDTAQSADLVADEAPATDFARTLRAMRPDQPSVTNVIYAALR